MTLSELVSKYVASAEWVVKDLRLTEDAILLDKKSTSKVVEYAITYLDDAKYYRDRKKLEVSLTAIAYCEGLLDALKLLGAVKFEWPTNVERRKAK